MGIYLKDKKIITLFVDSIKLITLKNSILFILLLGTTTITKAQFTNIPDVNFETALVDLGYDDVIDGQVLTDRIDTVQFLQLLGYNISDLTGIQDFNDLTVLDVTFNQLTEIDLSQNTELIELYCNGNQLTSLDVSHNLDLAYLWCEWNQLTELDLSENKHLTVLLTKGNLLTSLITTGADDLSHLDCSFNQIAELDLTQNEQLAHVDCQFNSLACINASNGNNTSINEFWLSGNPDLFCIEVDNVLYAEDHWSGDPQITFSENCNNDCSPSTGEINELTSSKNLIQILDMMGRETSFKPNTPLIYVYDDGSTEKVFKID